MFIYALVVSQAGFKVYQLPAGPLPDIAAYCLAIECCSTLVFTIPDIFCTNNHLRIQFSNSINRDMHEIDTMS